MKLEDGVWWWESGPADVAKLLDRAVNAKPCPTCMFGGVYPGETPELKERVEQLLADGIIFVCHTTDSTTCRGARDFQLAVFYQRGWIDEPTDEALRRMHENERRQAES